MKASINMLAFLILFLFACSKDGSSGPHWGEVTALYNGNNWSAEPYAAVNKPFEQGLDLLIDRFNEQGFHRDNIFIYKFSQKVGRQELKHTNPHAKDSLVGAAFFTTLDDGDVLGDSYKLLEGIIDNYIEISNIKDEELWGTFQVAFVKKDFLNEADPTSPDTIIFTNGKFHTKIVDPE